MRVAALYDIHGNLPALHAALRDIEAAAVDCVVVGGDVIPGPMPGESLACLRGLDVPVRYLSGNGEREVLLRLGGVESKGLPDAVREVIRWTGEQLSTEQRRQIGQWPEIVTLQIEGLGEVLFCHATPRSDSEIFTVETPTDVLRSIVAACGADIIVCGHTHMQFDRTVGNTRVVNAGSVGMPFGTPGAHWLLLGPDVELRRTQYDLPAAAARIRATDYPGAVQFAEENVLKPPTEADMLRVFDRSAIG